MIDDSELKTQDIEYDSNNGIILSIKYIQKIGDKYKFILNPQKTPSKTPSKTSSKTSSKIKTVSKTKE